MSAVEFQQLLTPAEAAKLLKISVSALASHVAAGRIRYIDVGCGKMRIRRRFDPADLAAFVDSRGKVACRSKNVPSRPIGMRDSSWAGGDFLDRLKRQTAATQKK